MNDEGEQNPADGSHEIGGSVHRHRRPSADPSPRLYRHLDFATEFLIYGILLFTPWAFGATENWAIESVNTWNYVLGGILVLKWLIRLVTGFKPPRWESPIPSKIGDRFVVWGLAFLTIFMLGYCWVSVWNARADFDFFKQQFIYHDYIHWLPASYVRDASLELFRRYVAAACFFWALRDWLRTKSPGETHSRDGQEERPLIGVELRFSARRDRHKKAHIPARMTRLLWFLCINGAILALEGAIQRFSRTNELLWIVLPDLNATADAQFGPYNYRSNGAQYLNVIWPICLAFWWALARFSTRRIGEGPEPVLLPMAAVVLGAPLISLSRGGVAVAAGQALGIIFLFAWVYRKHAWWKTVLPAALLIISVALFVSLQWDKFRLRFDENSMNTLSGRTEIYADARKMAEDFPLFGTGPGTFGIMYWMYRTSPDQLPLAYTHDDFLQTLVTFGRVGFTALSLMLALVFAFWFIGRGIGTTPSFVAFFWISIGGYLAHAKFDFPLQIYSLLLLFLTVCAMLTTFSRR